jgi:hypothetical protein
MGPGPNELDNKNLNTPTLKTEHYTTGRGGTKALTWR